MNYDSRYSYNLTIPIMEIRQITRKCDEMRHMKTSLKGLFLLIGSYKLQSLAKLLKKSDFLPHLSPFSPYNNVGSIVRLHISDGLPNVASAIFFISGGQCFEPTLFREEEGGGLTKMWPEVSRSVS